MLRWLLLIIIVVVVLAICLACTLREFSAKKIGGASAPSPTYLFSGYDGSYLWYLAELMQRDGARAANESGFVMRGEKAHASYLHKSLDNLYWFTYDNGPARGDFENVMLWPADAPDPTSKADLYGMITGKSYAPRAVSIAKFMYNGGKYIAHATATDHNFRNTLSGRGVTVIANDVDYNHVLETHYLTTWDARRHDPPVKYETFIMDMIPSSRINDRAFVLTLYVMLDGPILRMCDWGFICMCKNPEDVIALCLSESTVMTFPQEYPGDSARVLEQAREIVKDCEVLFRPGASEKNYKIYSMDVLVDENEKCWLLEFNSNYKFYDMLPRPPYSDAMRGIMDWTYQFGIKPRLFK